RLPGRTLGSELTSSTAAFRAMLDTLPWMLCNATM
ncbi:hypothetical protein Tco_1129163, partial [Tanacetum coccineum]